jgi:hypothetical protein
MSLAWNNYNEATNTAPGGKIHVGDGKFVDCNGQALDAEVKVPKLKEQIAALQAQLKDFEESAVKVETPKEADPAPVLDVVKGK